MLRRIRAERKIHTDTREDGETCQRKAEAAAIGAGGKRRDVKDLPSEIGGQRSIDPALGVRNHERCRVWRWLAVEAEGTPRRQRHHAAVAGRGGAPVEDTAARVA